MGHSGNVDFAGLQQINSPTVSVLRWGILGAGNISHDFALALRSTLSADPNSRKNFSNVELTLADKQPRQRRQSHQYEQIPTIHEIVAIAARDGQRARAFATKFDVGTAYTSYLDVATDPRIDVVYVGTIGINHYELCKMMLENGKHVLCEKPMCLLLEHTEELVELARTKKKFLLEGVWSRFFPVYRRLHAELEAKTIGDIQMVTAQYGYPKWSLDRMSRRDNGGGALHNIGVYVLSAALCAFGSEMPVSIQATSNKCGKENVDKASCITLKYANGALAQLTVTLMSEFPCEAFICGSSGYIKIKHPFWCPTEMVINNDAHEFLLPDQRMPANRKISSAVNSSAESGLKAKYINGSGMRYEVDEVARCIAKGWIESPLMTHGEMLTIARITQIVKDQIELSYQDLYKHV